VLALAPQMVLQLIRNMMQRSDYNWVPAPLLIVTEVLTLAFPLTLAYVIVVQRALDVRVVVRQGLQYALTRNGVVVMQALVIAGIILASVRLAEEPDVNRAERIALIAAGLAFIFAIGRGAARLRQSIDRRFFRESWRAEQILSALADDVRTIVSVGPLLETVARRISESLHVPRLAILLREGTCFQPAYALGYEWVADTEVTGVREVYVGQVGTRREYRGRGLARAALAKVLTEGARTGYQRASLGVDADNPTGALGLYESLGFSVHSKWITFRRAL